MSLGLDEELNVEEKKNEIIPLEEKRKRQPFAYWEVGGESYRMKLNTSTICKLEDKFKCNLMDILSRYGNIPPLNVMLAITQGAMMPWKHGLRYEHVQSMFDKYCEEGGTQLSFLTDVLIPIYQVSGFFSDGQQESMEMKLGEVKEML